MKAAQNICQDTPRKELQVQLLLPQHTIWPPVGPLSPKTDRLVLLLQVTAGQSLLPQPLTPREHQTAGCCFPESRAAGLLAPSKRQARTLHPGDGCPCHCQHVCVCSRQCCASSNAALCTYPSLLFSGGMALPLT